MGGRRGREGGEVSPRRGRGGEGAFSYSGQVFAGRPLK